MFKLEKKGKKMENQKAKLQNWKNPEAKQMEKTERQKGEKMSPMFYLFDFPFFRCFSAFILRLCFLGICWCAFWFFLFCCICLVFFKFVDS